MNDAVKTFPGLKNVAAKTRRIVSHFHHSPQATHRLSEMQKTLGAPQHKLKNQCPTRWNSLYYMIQRLVEQREPLSAVLASMNSVDNLHSHEWKVAESYVQVLKPFEEVTSMMSATRYSTLSMVIPLLNVLCEKMQLTHMNDFAKEILKNIKNRWPDYETNELFSVATYLDPRFGQYAFTNETAKEVAKAKILTCMFGDGETSGTDNTESNAEEVSETAVTAPTDESDDIGDVWTTFRKILVKNKSRSSESGKSYSLSIREQMQYELDLYSRISLVEPFSCPFQWWASNYQNFPNVSKVAKMYLAIPATSVPSERIFSKAGLVIDQRRSNLLPKHAERLICLSHNLREHHS